MNLKVIFSLFVARNREFYRDRGSMIWAFIFPLLVITVVTFAFQNTSQEIFKVGFIGDKKIIETTQLAKHEWITFLEYNDSKKALQRIRHHQLDLLILLPETKNEKNIIQYWVNSESSKSEAIELLLLQETFSQSLKKESVSGDAIRYVDWVIPGVLGMNIMFGALFGIGYVIVRYRKMEVLKRLQATPVTPFEFLSAQVASRLLMIVTVSCIMYSGCNYFLEFLMLGSYGLLLITAILGALSMIALGLVIASRTDSEELAGGLLNFATFPMLLFSEVWFSLDGAPQWMVQLANIMPLTHLVGAARKIMLEGASFSEVSNHLWTLGIMSIVFLLLASILFRWNKN